MRRDEPPSERRRDERPRLVSALVLAAGASFLVSAVPASSFAVFGERGMLMRGPRARTLPAPEPEEEPEPVERPRPPPDVGLTLARVRPLVTAYYNRQGQWSGQYVLDEVAQVRFVRHGADQIHAHVRYRYRCVLEHCGGSQRTGFDQRVFYLERSGGSAWRVTWMGGHMSAQM